jgi:Xaa-Pro aminopeptidase
VSTYQDRLQALRAQLKAERLDGFVVPLTDEHMSEYVGSYAQRLAWLTGFQGSAGSAVVLPEEAAIFTDGRYTLQVRDQVDGRHWSYQSVPETSIADWLKDHAPEGGRIGYDPWLHTRDWVTKAREALAARGAELVAVGRNPIDSIWAEQPQPSTARLIVHPDRYAGRGSAAKRQEMADWLQSQGADTAVLSALDSIAWTFNVRGADVDHTPVALSFALVHQDGTGGPVRLPSQADRRSASAPRQWRPRPRPRRLRAASAEPRRQDGGRRSRARRRRHIRSAGRAGAAVLARRDPAVLAKAIKNPAEVAGHRAAQARDGAAMTRFLHWLSIEGPNGHLTEISAANKLEEFRRAGGDLRDLSFDTISGAAPTARSFHYRVTGETNRPLERDSLYLIDFRRASIRTAPPTSPAPSRSARPPPRCATASAAC